MGIQNQTAQERAAKLPKHFAIVLCMCAAALAVLLCMALPARALAEQNFQLTASGSALAAQAELEDLVPTSPTRYTTFTVPANGTITKEFTTSERGSLYLLSLESEPSGAEVRCCVVREADGTTVMDDRSTLPQYWTFSLRPSTKYEFSVESYEDEDLKVTAGITEACVPKVTGLKTKSGKLSATVSFDKATNAEGYQVAYKKKGSSQWYSGTTANTTVRIPDLDAWSQYEVMVRGYFDYTFSSNPVRFYGEWSPQKTVKVTATVGKPTSMKAKAGAKKITVTFARGANGKQSQVAYKKAGAKKWTVKNVKNKTKVTLSNLKAGKKYSVRVRSYTKFGGKTYYGKWSAVKKATPTIDSALIGKWELVAMSGFDASKIKQLKQRGLVSTLTVKSNYTATMDVFGRNKMSMKWKKVSRAKGVFSYKSSKNIQASVSGKRLTLVENGTRMTFKAV